MQHSRIEPRTRGHIKSCLYQLSHGRIQRDKTDGLLRTSRGSQANACQIRLVVANCHVTSSFFNHHHHCPSLITVDHHRCPHTIAHHHLPSTTTTANNRRQPWPLTSARDDPTTHCQGRPATLVIIVIDDDESVAGQRGKPPEPTHPRSLTTTKHRVQVPCHRG